jgi:uncharacterized protein DUF6924
MEKLPKTQDSPVIRTDFDNEGAWKTACELIRRPVPDGFGGEFSAHVAFVENLAFRDLTQDELLARVPNEYGHSFLMIVDKVTLGSPEYPILLVDLFEERGRSFRAIPTQIQAIENNLSIANMDFAEFADYADADGVFRGHPE